MCKGPVAEIWPGWKTRKKRRMWVGNIGQSLSPWRGGGVDTQGLVTQVRTLYFIPPAMEAHPRGL